MGIVGSEVNHSLFCGENEALIRGEKIGIFKDFLKEFMQYLELL